MNARKNGEFGGGHARGASDVTVLDFYVVRLLPHFVTPGCDPKDAIKKAFDLAEMMVEERQVRLEEFMAMEEAGDAVDGE